MIPGGWNVYGTEGKKGIEALMKNLGRLSKHGWDLEKRKRLRGVEERAKEVEVDILLTITHSSKR